MPGSSKIRVFIACSVDGFIAGPDDDLSWLPGADGSEVGDGAASRFSAFLDQVGCLLMGRGTYDVVEGFGGAWPYGERPVLVATSRPLDSNHAVVRAVSGPIEELIETARGEASGRDVYIDGGNLIRQALDAGLINEMIVTIVPVVLGAGHSLFAGATRRHKLELVAQERLGGGMLEVTYRPAKSQ